MDVIMNDPGQIETLTQEHVRVVAYIVSNELAKFSSLLPSNLGRSIMVHSLVKALGLLTPTEPGHSTKIHPMRPVRANLKELAAYHTQDYLQFMLDSKNVSATVRKAEDDAEFGLEEDCPIFNGLPEYALLVAGASLTATRSLVNGHADIAICWDGGRHHAQKAQASGYCYIADCILSILTLRRSQISLPDGTFRKPRIMYLDLDLHFSDAVSQSFHQSSRGTASSQVLTLSIHYSSPGFFPPSPLSSLPDVLDPSFDPYTLSLPLAQGTSSSTYSKIWPLVEGIKDAFEPDYVVAQCGVDGLAGDPCAVWNWSLANGEGSLGWCVDRICNHWRLKTLLLGGGGYNSPNAARAWAYLTSVALERPLSVDADIPDHPSFPLYAPSFILDVPPGYVRDQNSDAYLADVQSRFETVIEVIQNRMTR